MSCNFCTISILPKKKQTRIIERQDKFKGKEERNEIQSNYIADQVKLFHKNDNVLN